MAIRNVKMEATLEPSEVVIVDQSGLNNNKVSNEFLYTTFAYNKLKKK